MNESELRAEAQRHGDAVVAGDMDTVMRDLAGHLHADLPALAGQLPQPVTAAEVLSVVAEPPGGVTTVTYSGADGQALTVRSTWALRGDRPVIVAVEPVD